MKIYSLLLSIEYGLSEVTPMFQLPPVDCSFCSGWQKLYHTWKTVNKETSSNPPLRPNFNVLYHCLYLRGCPQIQFVFYSGLWPLSSVPASPSPPSPIPPSGLTKNISATYMKICLYPQCFAQQQIWKLCYENFFSEHLLSSGCCHTLPNRFQASKNLLE